LASFSSARSRAFLQTPNIVCSVGTLMEIKASYDAIVVPPNQGQLSKL
jgi:hypothetical protein